ncbi:MAG TPA: hypothetical protein DEQ14_01080 [Treponema sp.]|nr:hypothetical protein [Treponema sp.]
MTVFVLRSVPASSAEEPSASGRQLYMTFSQGAAASWLTRIILQENRSNFVFRDFLPGLYFGAELRGIQHLVPRMRLTAYYPLVSTFNAMPQKSVNPLRYGIDMLAGADFEFGAKEMIGIHAGPFLHMFFMNSDRWNILNVGLAVSAGLELRFSDQWDMLVDGVASLDNGNLGMNRSMEPYDITYQYQIELGVRYRKKKVE